MMPTKRIYASLVLILLYLGTAAQEIIISEEINVKNDFSYEIIGWSNGETLLFRDKVLRYDILAYDADLVFKWSKEVTFEKKKINIIGFVKGEDNFTVVYHFRDRNDVYVLSRKFDAEGDEIAGDTLFVDENTFKTPRYFMEVSADNKKLLIVEAEKDNELTLFSIDLDSLELLWGRSIDLDNRDQKNELLQVIMSPDGVVYIIMDKNNTWSKRRSHAIEIRSYSQDQRNKLSIPVRDVLTYDVKFQFSPINDALQGIMSYTEKSDNRTKGIIFMNATSDLSDSFQKYQTTFDDKLLQDIYGKDVPRKKGLKDLTVRHLQPRMDGGIVALLELSKEYSRRPSFPASTTSGYGSRRWVDYYFEDVIAYSFHPDGELHWNDVLHKRQYSQDDDAVYSSFFVFQLPSSLRIIFNDEIRNENTVSEYLLTGRGLEKRNSLMSTDYQGLKLKFREAIQISPHEILVPSQRSGRLNLVKVRYSTTTRS